MVNGQKQTVLCHLHKVLGVPENSDLPDRLLLKHFAATRDERAFATLVRRHGALVWGVCWRALRHTEDAEDCFQATFVVLARRVGSVRWHESIANWLYGVAWRMSAEAKARRTRRRERERQEMVMPEESPMPDDATRDLCSALDEELRKLPPRYQDPLLLCYLEGRTTDQAAHLLGWSQRTLERRLAQGRDLLRARLMRRGLALSTVLLGVSLVGQTARASVRASCVTSTIESAISPTAKVSGAMLALVDAATKGMAMTKLKLASLAALLLGAMVGSAALFGMETASNDEAGPVRKAATGTPDLLRQAALDRDGNDMEKPTEGAVDDLARRTWAILEVVEKNHIKPPNRNDVLLNGARALLKAANVDAPEDLAKRVSGVSSEQQLRALLRDIWPKDGVPTMTAAAKLENALLEGLFDSIPGKPYLQTEAALKIQDQLRANRYVGTGVQIAVNEKEKLIQITIPFRRGPALRAGALPGDLILEVDGKSTKGLVNVQTMVQMLRGPEGTSVTMVVRQPGVSETRTLKVTRGIIPIDSLLGFKRAGEDWDYTVDAESRIAYVWVSSIKSSTLHELRQVERHLQANGTRALVLDFRLSKGEGHLHDAALLASSLLDGKLMWTARDAHDAPKASHAERDPLFRDLPIAVLVNDIDDNAQGAVLAALQDNRRAVLVGEPTKTDGAIRRIFRLPNEDGSITVLTGQLERADKTRGWPVVPDRRAELTKEQRAEVEKWLRDKQLPVLPPGAEDRVPKDPQLTSALAVLRDAIKKKDSSKGRAEEERK